MVEEDADPRRDEKVTEGRGEAIVDILFDCCRRPAVHAVVRITIVKRTWQWSCLIPSSCRSLNDGNAEAGRDIATRVASSTQSSVDDDFLHPYHRRGECSFLHYCSRAAMAEDIRREIHAHLQSRHLPPTQQWLEHFAASIRPSTPLPALQKTAEFRLLGTDFTASLHSTAPSTFPAGVSQPEIKELRIPGPIPVQILDIEDIGKSRWSQVEAMEMEERGETRKGHEVIRVVPEEDSSDPHPPSTTAGPGGPHKLLLQDAKGNKVYAFELEDVLGVDLTASIGSKLMLHDFTVARGIVLLTKRCATVLGGKIEAWDKKWREDRKQMLKAKAG